MLVQGHHFVASACPVLLVIVRGYLPVIRLLQQGLEVKSVPTKPIEGQKTGTSGLRKKTTVFTSENYLANWCNPKALNELCMAGVDLALHQLGIGHVSSRTLFLYLFGATVHLWQPRSSKRLSDCTLPLQLQDTVAVQLSGQ